MFLLICDLHLVLVPWTEICKVILSFCSIKCDRLKKGKQDTCRLSHSLEDYGSAKLYLSIDLCIVCLSQCLIVGAYNRCACFMLALTLRARMQHCMLSKHERYVLDSGLDIWSE